MLDIGQLPGCGSCPFLKPPDFLPRGVLGVPEAPSEVREEISINKKFHSRELSWDKCVAGVSGFEKRLLPGEVGL